MSKRNDYAVWMAVVSLSCAGSAFADMTREDVLNHLHQSNQVEIRLGELAQSQGASTDVQNYGKDLVSDHRDNDKKVLEIASKEGIKLKQAEPGMLDELNLKQLKSLSGTEFDRKFAKQMLDDHKKDIAKLESAVKSPLSEDVRELVSNTLPTLQKHLEKAQKIYGSPS